MRKYNTEVLAREQGWRSCGLLWVLMMIASTLPWINNSGPFLRGTQDVHNRAEEAQVKSQRARYNIAIRSVLAEDAKISRMMNAAQRALAMQRIDTSQCPPEFRIAYLDLVFGWRYVADVRRARSELARNGFVESALARHLLSADGPSKAPIEDLLRSDDRMRHMQHIAQLGVKDSIKEVIRVARSYDCAAPTTD